MLICLDQCPPLDVSHTLSKTQTFLQRLCVLSEELNNMD